MLTLQQLGESLTEKHKSRIDFMFYADHYQVIIKYSDKMHISIVLESLMNYNKDDKIQRLLHYVRQNTTVLGYMRSSLAYNKNNDVIVQKWLDKFISVKDILYAIEYLLIHADILTQARY
jgi:hypothetical protein